MYVYIYVCMYVCMYVYMCVCIINNAAVLRPHSKLTVNKEIQLSIPLLLPCLCQQQICHSNTTYMPHMQISSCTTVMQVSQYICLIGTHWDQQCDKKHCCTYTFPLLAYAPKQICLPYCTKLFHNTATVVYIQNQHWCINNSYNQDNAAFIYMLLSYMWPAPNMHLINERIMQIYMPNKK